MRSAAFAVVVGACLAAPVGASSTSRPGGNQGGGHPITICHRTDSTTHPYVRKTVDAASTNVHGHEGHTGSVYFNGHPKEPKWGDIIPPTDDDHDLNVTPLNWNLIGQGFWNNGCNIPFGPPPGAPTITCNLISIDPPQTTGITVTFYVTINGVLVTRSVSYGYPTPHIATANISDLTTTPGPLHISAYATWTLGPGKSFTADATVTCHPNV